MRKISTLVVFFLAVLLTVTAYSQDQKGEIKKEVSSADVKKETGEAVKTTGTFVKQEKDRYQRKAEDKLRRAEDNIKKLGKKAEKAGDKTKEKFSKAAQELRLKSEAAKNKLGELEAAGEEKWDKVKMELDAILRDLERTYNRATSQSKRANKGD